MDLETLQEMEKQRRRDIERKQQEEREQAYKEASHSSTFRVFDSIIGTITTIMAVTICLVFLWQNSKIIFAFVTVMLVLSYIFRRLSKYYFIHGNRRKFELFNKLAGIMGVSASIVELADYNHGKTKGAFDKVDSLDSSVRHTYRAITDISVTGGVYVDVKYDAYRTRCIEVGKYIYMSLDRSKVQKVLKEAKDFRDSAKRLPKECIVTINVLYMLVKDYAKGKYELEDETVVYAAIGALHFFVHPLSNVPDSAPVVGYSDNMLMPLCVTGGYVEQLNAYKDWKIKGAKQKELERLATKNSDLVQRLHTSGAKYIGDDSAGALVLLYQKGINDTSQLSEEVKQRLHVISQLVEKYTHGDYTNIDQDVINACVGVLAYWVKQDDLIHDKTPITGLVDDELIISTVYELYKSQLEKYEKWQVNQYLENSEDPLTDYLNTVIGESVPDREKEIKRLAAMCQDDSIKGIEDRARAAVEKFL